ncbi:type II toxin-antitoxin system VapC family toxin [Rhizobium panacihumi]|uniref:type II toxin-antitoxin system VapC family toxin n=1 Tax=Rhizobium panacihumi TaxID=2008450 RepID=UPI003D78DF5A
MNALLLDTHTWVWSLTGDRHLSDAATKVIRQADSVWVSPISFFEIGQKVRIGKWPEMEALVGDLSRLLEEQRGRIASITPEISLKAGIIAWEHRDPFDRMIASTALQASMPIVSADQIFDTLPGIKRIW